MPAKCGLIAVVVHCKVSPNAIDRRQGSTQYREALSYHLQTYMRATAFPSITGTTKRNSSSLHPVRRSVHHHRGATNIRQPLCPILAYMVDSRRAPDSGEVLMAIDTSGDIPDKVIADIPHGASALGGALARRPSETVKTYHGLSSLLPGRGEAAGGGHFIHYDGTSYAGGRRKGADEPYAADKWTESIDLRDITDDSMRLYLTEIGRVNLLTAKQEADSRAAD